jgi:hypothetical protein
MRKPDPISLALAATVAAGVTLAEFKVAELLIAAPAAQAQEAKPTPPPPETLGPGYTALPYPTPAHLFPDRSCRVRDRHGNLVRSISRRNEFLRIHGLKDPPDGYVVDHIVPLVCGGCDLPSNMALMRAGEMRQKDDAVGVRRKAPLCNVPMWPRADLDARRDLPRGKP